MILMNDAKGRKSLPRPDAAPRSTIDSLFARAVQNRPQALALKDAPNREAVIGSAARGFTFAEADRMVSRIAAQLQELGLGTDSVVAIMMPTVSEQALTLLGVLRAGLVPAPVPVGWGRRELADYVQTIGARCIITLSRSGAVDTADLARFAAAESFSVRFVLAFGQNVPDGVISLDHLWHEGPAEVAALDRGAEAADHVAILTVDAQADGFVAVPRTHSQLIAAGIAAYVTLRPTATAVIAGTLSLDALAGLATQFVPWLVSASTLILHPPFSASVFRAALAADRATHVVMPAAAAIGVLGADDAARASLRSLLLVARRGEDAALASRVPQHMAGVAVHALFVAGEAGLVPVMAAGGGARLPLGPISFVPPGEKAAPIVAARIGADGQLELAGPMVATHAYPPGIDRAAGAAWRLEEGHAKTGFPVGLDKMVGAAAITGARLGVITVGSRSFPEAGIRALYADVGGAIAPIVRFDPVLGQRVSGVAGDGRAAIGLAAKLEESGVTQLMVPGAARIGARIPVDDTGPDDRHASDGEKAVAHVEAQLQQLRAAGA